MTTDRKAPGMDVQLGEVEVRVVAQPQARITKRLMGKNGVVGDLTELGDLASSDVEAGGLATVLDAIGDRVYEVLCVFIPELERKLPRHEFLGYVSKEAMENDDYDEEADPSPTHPQVIAAFQTAVQVNGLGWLKKAGSIVDPKVVRAQISLMLVELRKKMQTRMESSSSSPSLPPQNGASDPISSGESPATTPPAPTSA